MIRRLLSAAKRLLANPPPSPPERRFKCDASDSARFHETARVVNLRPDPEAIQVGANTHIRGELLTFRHGGRISMGEYCYLGEQSRIWSAGNITIGNRVLIAHLVTIIDNLTHPISPAARHRQYVEIITSGHPEKIDLKEQPITIEDDAWIGAHSVILPGVVIGQAAVVGAGSVVTEDVPAYTVVAGNPARFVKSVPRDDQDPES